MNPQDDIRTHKKARLRGLFNFSLVFQGSADVGTVGSNTLDTC